MRRENAPEPDFFFVNRSLLRSDRWLSEPFTRGQAWVDMFGLANHTDGYIRLRGNKITVKRGQLGYSQQSLAERWRWSRGKVVRFLKELQNDGDIVQQTDTSLKYNFNLITILKYDFWQGTKTQNRATDGTTDSTVIIKNNKNILDNISNRSNDHVNFLLSQFKDFYGFDCTDYKPRNVAWNFSQKISTAIKELGGQVTPDVTKKMISLYFKWLQNQDWAEKVQKLETLKLKIPIFVLALKEKNYVPN